MNKDMRNELLSAVRRLDDYFSISDGSVNPSEYMIAIDGLNKLLIALATELGRSQYATVEEVSTHIRIIVNAMDDLEELRSYCRSVCELVPILCNEE